jgi:uncharacterized glyoxalase superfamily protein PhnB
MLANRSMPRSTVIPSLAFDHVGQASDWLCDRFGFTERWRAGNHRAQLAVGDGAVILTERSPDRGSTGTPELMVRVEDARGHYERARQRGVRILKAPADYPYGERQYTAEDLAGNRWHFSQSIADVAPEDWGGTTTRPPADSGAGQVASAAEPSIAPWLAVSDAVAAIDFYEKALGAVAVYRLDSEGGRVAVAQLRVGAAELWLQEDPGNVGTVRLIVTVGDPDALFERAVGAGAAPVAQVHEEHGWRTGRVTDPDGYDWEFARATDS